MSTGGEKLRELLIKHGSVKNVELHLSKYAKKTEKDGKFGRWVTKQFLIDHHKYTKWLALCRYMQVLPHPTLACL